MKKIDSIISKIPTMTMVSVIYMICNILQRGISFIVVPIYTRIVPSEEYGLYSIYQSWLAVLTLFATLSMWNYVYSNGMIKYEDRKDEFTSALIGLSGIVSLLILGILFIFRKFVIQFSGLSLYLILLMFTEIFFRPPFEYWYARQRFEYKIKNYVIVSLLISIFQPLLCIFLVKISDIIGLAHEGEALITGKSVCVLIAYSIVLVCLLKKSLHLFDLDIWRFAFKFSFPLIPHFLAGILLQQSDRLMISIMCDTKSVAIYSLAYNGGMILFFVNEALINVIVPWTYKKIKKDDFSGFTQAAGMVVGLISIINILLSICAPELVAIMAPSEYSDAVYIIPPVAISGVFMCLYNFYANVEYYYEETKLVAIASSMSAIINIILNYIFIGIYGYIAAGYTTVICYFFYALFHLLFMKHVLRKKGVTKKVYNNRILWGESIVATIICIASISLFPYPLIRYFIVALAFISVLLNRKKLIQKYRFYRGN